MIETGQLVMLKGEKVNDKETKNKIFYYVIILKSLD